jgi:hypothetical protein
MNHTRSVRRRAFNGWGGRAVAVAGVMPDARGGALDDPVVLKADDDVPLARRVRRDVVGLDHGQAVVAGDEADLLGGMVRAEDAAVARRDRGP